MRFKVNGIIPLGLCVMVAAALLAAQVPGTEPARLTGWAQVIVGACERLAVWRGQDESVTAEQATEYLMDLVWTGLAGLGHRV